MLRVRRTVGFDTKADTFSKRQWAVLFVMSCALCCCVICQQVAVQLTWLCLGSWYSSVGIVTGSGQGQGCRSENKFCSKTAQTGFGTCPATYHCVPVLFGGYSSPGVKLPFSPSRAKVKSKWSCTYTSLCVFMTWTRPLFVDIYICMCVFVCLCVVHRSFQITFFHSFF